MTTPIWPTSLPQAPLVDQWTGGPQRNIVSFQPEIGPSITRRRGSSALSVWEAAFPPFDATQLAAFRSFFEDDLFDGVLAFQWDDPITGTTCLWRFADEEPPYKITATAASLYMVSMKLIKLT